jgi:hypothetical protein
MEKKKEEKKFLTKLAPITAGTQKLTAATTVWAPPNRASIQKENRLDRAVHLHISRNLYCHIFC